MPPPSPYQFEVATRIIQTSHSLPQSKKEQSQAARSLAADLLKNLGARETSVLQGPNREPIWPRGFSGSISHCRISEMQSMIGVAVCGSENSQNDHLVGIDIESQSRLAQIERVQKMILDQEEIRIAEGFGPLGKLLSFSAKEALFKAYFPVVQKIFWFDSARLVGIESECLKFEPRGVLKECGLRKVLEVKWRLVEPECVLTIVHELNKAN